MSGIYSRHSRGYVTRTVLTAELYGRTYTTIPISFSLTKGRTIQQNPVGYSAIGNIGGTVEDNQRMYEYGTGMGEDPVYSTNGAQV